MSTYFYKSSSSFAIVLTVSRGLKSAREKLAFAENHVALEFKVTPTFLLVAFGDIRSHDPSDKFERHQLGGMTYFVTGAGGAYSNPIVCQPDDLYNDSGVNFHYLPAAVDHQHTATMRKVKPKDGKEIWSQPDSAAIAAPTDIPAVAY